MTASRAARDYRHIALPRRPGSQPVRKRVHATSLGTDAKLVANVRFKARSHGPPSVEGSVEASEPAVSPEVLRLVSRCIDELIEGAATCSAANPARAGLINGPLRQPR